MVNLKKTQKRMEEEGDKNRKETQVESMAEQTNVRKREIHGKNERN